MFTPQEQAAHCRQLADFLETSASAIDHYDHDIYVDHDRACGTAACALGWATTRGIGGLYFSQCKYPALPGMSRIVSEVADRVFGNGAWDRIFTPIRFDYGQPGEVQRKGSIELLRNQAALLETQPELA